MRAKRRLLVLGGGLRFALPVIEAAHQMDCHVITMDNVPGNFAHQRSDEYVNVSIVDKSAVLAAARELRVDGIMSFAADPGVVSAAYATEKLGLPFQGSYSSVCTLQNKGRFRSFLSQNGFNCPEAHVFSNCEDARFQADSISYPVIVKPTDSAGSKGCTRVDRPGDLEAAVSLALEFSVSGSCIVEQFIEKAFPSSDSDCFTVDGRFQCVSFTAQLFDGESDNPYVPAAYCMPCEMPEAGSALLAGELQRLSDLLGLRSGIYNVETRIGADGLPYIMEVSPRGGGNRLAEMLRYASGVDLISAAVQAALGETPQDVRMPCYDGYWYMEVLHCAHGGIFRGIEYAGDFREEHVRDEQVWIEPGTSVPGFRGANNAFGNVIMRFDSREDIDAFRASKSDYMRVRVD